MIKQDTDCLWNSSLHNS